MGRRKKQSEKQMIDIDLVQEIAYYEKPRKTPKINQRLVLGGAMLLLIIVGFLFSPLFAVKTITTKGAVKYTSNELAEKISLNVGENLIFFGRGRAEKILEEDPYIADAKLRMELPGTMVIEVVERKVRGYVPYMGAYLYIDEEGRVLETQNTYYEALPQVKGLQFDSFVLGEVLPVANKDALLVVLQISQMMQKYNLLDIVVQVDVSNSKDVYAYVNQIEIRLGNMEGGEQKIRVMAEIVKTIPEGDRGTLDLRDLNKPLVFQYLT